MRTKTVCSLIFLIISFLIITSLLPVYALENQRIAIPSIEAVQNDGYPKNTKGQTYGPNTGDVDIVPDLILARNQDGILGYIKAEDFNKVPASIEEALEITKNTHIREIPMYLHDGVAQIGTFCY